ncbi:MAG: hypothetical protein HYR72_03075 [Deltaproteobacteria bacterium]|nr:hypothetical protein [Deltaproteobacteria bacterium]MBI3388394.1 hypothetical protein [Deltaproteobacteria bacterium]
MQHKHRRVIIVRHGKPCVAIVPVDVAAAASRTASRPKGLTRNEVRHLFRALGKKPSRRPPRYSPMTMVLGAAAA